MDLRPKLPCSVAELQRRLEAPAYSPLHRVISGKRRPSVSLAKRIEAATGGAIRWIEFFDDTEAPKPPPKREAA